MHSDTNSVPPPNTDGGKSILPSVWLRPVYKEDRGSLFTPGSKIRKFGVLGKKHGGNDTV